MKKLLLASLLLLDLLVAAPATASMRFILHAPAAAAADIAARHGLTISSQIDGHEVFLALADDGIDCVAMETSVRQEAGVVSFESDAEGSVPELAGATLNQSTTSILDAISTRSIVTYFGRSVANYYVKQTAAKLIRLPDQQSTYGFTGNNIIVAVIDTGIDPNHAALAGAIITGYDFTRNVSGVPSELADVAQSTTSILDQSTTSILDRNSVVALNSSTVAILSQSTTSILDTTQIPAAYGHGTMVAGIIHLVAPQADIMPLKTFLADGTASIFDIVRAIYYAVDHGAKVINMSFSMPEDSPELVRAINYATRHGVVCVSSTGNSGQEVIAYPASLQNVVGVASTDALDQRSSFSNYGAAVADMAAPGEGIITTYPGNGYAAGWGTSFSTPLVSGAAALLFDVSSTIKPLDATQALSKAKVISDDLGFGRLDALQAVQALRRALGD